jgi:hypothetical protein
LVTIEKSSEYEYICNINKDIHITPLPCLIHGPEYVPISVYRLGVRDQCYEVALSRPDASITQPAERCRRVKDLGYGMEEQGNKQPIEGGNKK